MKYSLKEEMANSITHGIGAILSIIAFVFMVIYTFSSNNIWQIISVITYGITLILLYTMSTLYHALRDEKRKKLFKIFDHASIYLLIAGTYTPFFLILLRNNGNMGWIIFIAIWIIAILGIIIGTVFIGRLRILKSLTYVFMGWIAVLVFPDLMSIMKSHNTLNGLYYLIAGGISYTFGVIFYMLKIKYFHSIWHIFVLLGSLFHFISIMFYVI